ncbi:MAG: acetyltransferase, family [Anaerocolumna sp.]|jgi:predicted N-acetyltransferase YhbS|nr:acetyltransferase, family [Anaerocolumna sp.]
MSEEKNVLFTKGNDAYHDELIDLINYVFNMNGRENDFYRLLPKLYKKEYHPSQFNYLALEDNKIKAAVGSYPGEMYVCGSKLTYEGIGNVAVHPYCNSKGYMKILMNQAVDAMIRNDVDFSSLAGRRNRYAYFSYEIVGRKYSFWLDESNIKHNFRKDRKERFQFVLVDEKNVIALDEIAKLQNKQITYYEREDSKLFDYLKNWKDVDVYGIYEENRFSGYLLCYNKNTIKEIQLTTKEDIQDVVADFLNNVTKSGLTLEVPDYQRYYVDSLSKIAESVSIQDKENFSVFNYGKVIEAFLKLKAKTDPIADGEIVFNIHGKKKDEKLLISVKGETITVKPTEQETTYEYAHLEAMQLLFGNYSPLRTKLPIEVQSWLPLPLYIFPADEV